MKLDYFIQHFHFNEVHSIDVKASADAIYHVLKNLKITEVSPLFSMLFNIRRIPSLMINGKSGGFKEEKPIIAQMIESDFFILHEEIGKEFVFGAIGQFWRPVKGKSIDIKDPEDFKTFKQPDYAIAGANFMIETLGDNTCRVRTETRIQCPSQKAKRIFGLYWFIIFPGSALIRRVWLKGIKRKAERIG